MGKLLTFSFRCLSNRRLLALAAVLLALSLTQPFSGDARAALTNPGFETGNLSGWTTGATQEGVFVVGTDLINADEGVSQTPLEGDFMVRLGAAQASAAATQAPGQNQLIQEFIITDLRVRLAYNIWTYDFTGFDRFSVELRLVSPSEVLYSYSQQDWGTPGDTSRKSTGWRVLDIPIPAQHQGKLARLTISAGGTVDDLYAFWVYVDSAETAVPPEVVDTTQLKVNGHPPSIDPASGTVHVTPAPASSSLHIEALVLCPDASVPAAVTAVLGTSPPRFPPLTKGGGNIWSGSIPLPPEAAVGTSWPLTFLVLCEGTTVPVAAGAITIVDPSGTITDAETGLPIAEATVTLQRQDGNRWVKVNPFALVNGNPAANPPVNPQLTDGEGRYGWLVSAGTYRIVAKAPGYLSQIGPQATVPPSLSALDLALLPLSAILAWDVDCDGDLDSVDSLMILRHVVGLPVSQGDPCPEIGSTTASIFGDVDCDDDVDAVDALNILRQIVGLPLSLPPGCPPIGPTS